MLDYSKQVARLIRNKPVSGHVNSVIHDVEDAVKGFEGSMQWIESLISQVLLR